MPIDIGSLKIRNFQGGRGGGGASGGNTKLIVNNLDFGVTDADMEVNTTEPKVKNLEFSN